MASDQRARLSPSFDQTQEGVPARSAWSVWATLWIVVLAPAAAEAQNSLPVPDEPACARCRIELGRRVAFRGEDGQGTINKALTVRRGVDGRFFVVHDAEINTIHVYASDGTLSRLFGRGGEGPGEYAFIGSLYPDTSGKLHVFDRMLGRRTIVDARSALVVHTNRLPPRVWGGVVLESGEIVVSGPLGTRQAAGYPLHLFDSAGEWIRSFGLDVPALRADTDHLLWRWIKPATRSSIWAAPLNEYLLEMWTADGTLVRRLQGERGWFEPWVRSAPPSPETPPRPILMDIEPDADGQQVWVLINVPAPEWREAISDSRDIMGNRLLDPGREYRNAVVEVLDPVRGRVVARRRFPHVWGGFAAPGWLWRTWVDQDGIAYVEAAEVRLVGAR